MKYIPDIAERFEKQLAALRTMCATTSDPHALRAALQRVSWSRLEARLETIPMHVLEPMSKFVCRNGVDQLNTLPEHHSMDAAIRLAYVTRKRRTAARIGSQILTAVPTPASHQQHARQP